MQLQVVDALGDRGVRPGQEARPDTDRRHRPPQVKAGRLDLVGLEIVRARIPPAAASAAIIWSGRMPFCHGKACGTVCFLERAA